MSAVGARGADPAQRHPGGQRRAAEGRHRQYRHVLRRRWRRTPTRSTRILAGPGEVRRRRQQAGDGQLRTDRADRSSPTIAALPTGQLTIAAADYHRRARHPAHHAAEAPTGWCRPSTTSASADSIPLLVQSRLIQGFENAGDPRVGTDASGITGDFQLLVNIRKFQMATIGEPTAEVALMAKLRRCRRHR